MKRNLILASASKRRSKILSGLGVSFTIVSPEVDEIIHTNNPEGTVIENSMRKNDWCRARFSDAYIMSADTIVKFNSCIVTKPESPEEARKFLKMLSGQTHRVFTGVAFSRPGSPPVTQVDVSSVTFKDLTEKMIDDYLYRVNPMDRAGAYDIDENGDLLIASFTGSRTNIMGLSEETAAELLKAEGLL